MPLGCSTGATMRPRCSRRGCPHDHLVHVLPRAQRRLGRPRVAAGARLGTQKAVAYRISQEERLMDDKTKTVMLTLATGVIKKGLMVAGPGLASHGVISSSQTEMFVAAGMGLVGLGWSFWN